MTKHTRHGRSVEAGQWAGAEFGVLCDLWEAGLPVPYPVQLDGTEILMEFITVADGSGAPRLAQTRPDHDRLREYWEQLHQAMAVLAGRQQTHGDLSAYNLLAADDRLVIIDLPQVTDIVGNPHGMEFLARDCRNVCSWFSNRGLELDADELLAELTSYAW
jgi:RIO kinase 1